MSKLDQFRKSGGAAKTMNTGASRFDAVEKTIFGGAGEGAKPPVAELRTSVTPQPEAPAVTPPASQADPAPAKVAESVEARKKLTLTLSESDWKTWRMKLAEEGKDGQKVLEGLVKQYLAS